MDLDLVSNLSIKPAVARLFTLIQKSSPREETEERRAPPKGVTLSWEKQTGVWKSLFKEQSCHSAVLHNLCSFSLSCNPFFEIWIWKLLRRIYHPEKTTNKLAPLWQNITGNLHIHGQKLIAFSYSDPGGTLEKIKQLCSDCSDLLFVTFKPPASWSLAYCDCYPIRAFETFDISKEPISKTFRFWMFWYKQGCNWLGAIKGMALWSRGFSRGSLLKIWPKPETAHEKPLAPRVANCLHELFS